MGTGNLGMENLDKCAAQAQQVVNRGFIPFKSAVCMISLTSSRIMPGASWKPAWTALRGRSGWPGMRKVDACVAADMSPVVICEVVEAFKAASTPDKVKIMVGGAPVTQEFCASIGTNYYTDDAVSNAICAAEILSL